MAMKRRDTNMQTFNLKTLAKNEDKKEYVLGLKDLQTHAVYMIYGVLEPGEKDRKLHPGKGHEEILCIIKGHMELSSQNKTRTISIGEAMYLKEDDIYYIENKSDKTSHYILAGGHNIEDHR